MAKMTAVQSKSSLRTHRFMAGFKDSYDLVVYRFSLGLKTYEMAAYFTILHKTVISKNLLEKLVSSYCKRTV